ncbi:MAG: tetratricopeptide repeat protein [Deltaproteobacteria bacterium]|nr:tetratricopeptide repeat protein [Deltaproteobacteria bacterium]
MYSRFFQPLGLKRRLPLSDDSHLLPAHTLRYVEIVAALRDERPAQERLALLCEKADIDVRGGRYDVALAGLDTCAQLAADIGPAAQRAVAYQTGRARYVAGDLGPAKVAFESVVAEPHGTDALAGRALLQLARVLVGQGRFSESVRVLRRALDGGMLGGADRLAGQYDLAYGLAHEGLYDQAEQALVRAEVLIAPGDSMGRARLSYYRGWVAFSRRRIDVAAVLVDDARREFHLQREPISLACAELMRACIDFERADLQACIDRCDRVSDDDVARPDIAVSFLMLRGLALFVAGRFAEAESEYRRAERLAALRERDSLVAWAQRWRADLHVFCGDYTAAREALKTCLRVRRAVGDSLGAAMALTALAHAHRSLGDSAEAAQCFEEARAIADRLGNRWELANLAADEMEVHFLRGDVQHAERCAHVAAEHYRAIGDAVRLSRVHKHLAQIAAVRDDFDTAEAEFAQALALVADDPNRILRAEILDSRAEARADGGRVDDALRDLHQALELVQPTGAVHLANAIANHTVQVRERHAAQQVLSRYMEPKIVSRLLSRGPRRLVENVEQEASVLFSDVRGFTTLTEQLGPHDVVDLLNQHFEAMTEEIVAQGGTIDKFIGDAVMAVFGDPGRPRPDDAARCVQAAMAMVRRRRALNDAALARRAVALNIGVGVATGNVVMGNIGSPRRMTYTVIGDAVNVASRLESLTKEARRPVLIDAATRARLGEGFAVDVLGELAVRGRTGLVPAFAVEA